MKNNNLFFASIFIAGMAITGMIFSCRSNGNATLQKTDGIVYNKTQGVAGKQEANESEPDKTAEFNRLKDPVTGNIPSDIHEREQKFAESMRKQSLTKGATHTPNVYSSVGPTNQGGRTRAIGYDVSGQYILAAGVSGGMFRSTNDGASWTPVSVPDVDYTITCVAQDPRPGYQNTWYYGTGEPNSTDGPSDGNHGHALPAGSVPGNGIWKSINGGLTWSKVTDPAFSTPATSFIYKIAIDSSTGNIYVATSDAIYQGLWSATSVTWSHLLGQGNSNQTDADQGYWTDVVVTPGGMVIAAFSGLLTNGDDGIWESLGGSPGTWSHIAGTGSPNGPTGWAAAGYYGRIVLSLVHCDQLNINNSISFYAAYSHTTPLNNSDLGVNLYKFEYIRRIYTGNPPRIIWEWEWTDNSVNLPPPTYDSPNTQGDYCFTLAVQPKALYNNPDVVFLGGVYLYYSNNGFATANNYTTVTGATHTDNHTVVFKPVANNNEVFLGCDGGVYKGTISYSGTTISNINWAALTNGYQTTQFYCVNMTQNTSATWQYVGSLQDNASMLSAPSQGAYWYSVSEGDGQWCAIDGQGNYYTGSSATYFERNGVNVSFPSFSPSFSYAARYFPGSFILDQSNTLQPNVIYYPAENGNTGSPLLLIANNALTIPNNTGTGWAVLPLTFEAPITALAMSYGSYTTGGSYNTNVVLYAGTEDGGIYRITDPQNYFGLLSATLIRSPQTGDGCISSIAVDPNNPNDVMFTESNYNSLMGVGYTLNALTSGVQTWYYETGNLNALSIRSSAIAEGPSGPMYFVGTSAGLYSLSATAITYNTSPNNASPVWIQEGSSTVAYAIVNSLSYRVADNKLLIGTFGNGVYLGALGSVSLPNSVQNVDANTENNVVIYPNPARAQNVSVSFNLTESKKSTIELINIEGKVVYTDGHECNEGNNTLTIPTSGLSSGIYFVRVNDMPAQKLMILK